MSEFIDPYLDPATGVLRNLVGATSAASLQRLESDLVFARRVELAAGRSRLRRTNDLVELRAIHRHLFQDVYPWAGQLRVVDISKGGSTFVPVALLERAAGFVFESLREARFLRGLNRDEFITALARHYDQLNHLHPFRESNGRTQRAFWSRVAADAGWPLDWRRTSREINDKASRESSVTGDLGRVSAMLSAVVSPEPAAGLGSDPVGW